MTEGFRSPPPPSAGVPPRTPDTSPYRREATDTVQRIMGDDLAPMPVTPTPVPSAGESSTPDVAKQQTAAVADTAKQAGTQVAGTVKEQAGQVTDEAKNQAKQLLTQAQSELSEQAASTQHRVSEGLYALADELTGMAKNSEQDGPATDLTRQAADKAQQAAGWLADRDPGSLLNEVRAFARKKPGTYLALALGAGVVAGRLTRGLTAPTDDVAAPHTPSSAPGSVHQIGNGRPALSGTERSGTVTGFETAPVADPVLSTPLPVTGAGNGIPPVAGFRGDVAP